MSGIFWLSRGNESEKNTPQKICVQMHQVSFQGPKSWMVLDRIPRFLICCSFLEIYNEQLGANRYLEMWLKCMVKTPGNG